MYSLVFSLSGEVTVIVKVFAPRFNVRSPPQVLPVDSRDSPFIEAVTVASGSSATAVNETVELVAEPVYFVVFLLNASLILIAPPIVTLSR